VKKKLQHYVFQAYLKPWSNNEQIYCLREGKIFPSNLRGVACERFFYALQDLTPDEVKLIEETLIDKSSEPLRRHQKYFLDLCLGLLKIKKNVLNHPDSGFTSVVEELVTNAREDYHQIVEDDLLPFLNLMLEGNTDFYLENAQAAKFLYALSVQFTRTKQVRETAAQQIGSTFNGCDIRRVISVISDIIAMGIGQSLYIDKDQFKLILIDSDTDPFIASDQPIINLHATFDGKPPGKLEFFYPLSPHKAMLLVEASSKKVSSLVSAVSVNNYNILIAQNSHEQVFSNSEEYLNTIRHVISSGSGRQRLKT
jgi:hypothetical protein